VSHRRAPPPVSSERALHLPQISLVGSSSFAKHQSGSAHASHGPATVQGRKPLSPDAAPVVKASPLANGQRMSDTAADNGDDQTRMGANLPSQCVPTDSESSVKPDGVRLEELTAQMLLDLALAS